MPSTGGQPQPAKPGVSRTCAMLELHAARSDSVCSGPSGRRRKPSPSSARGTSKPSGTNAIAATLSDARIGPMSSTASTRGLLEPDAAAAHFRLTRFPPSADLSPFVERHWIVAWDLRGRPPFTQEVLPHPCVNLVVEPGLAAVHGVGSGRFARELHGFGRAVGVKFRPGGFRPFVDFDIAELTGGDVTVDRLFGVAGAGVPRPAEAPPHDPAPGRGRGAL